VSDRLNDVDLLGEPRSCGRLPAYVWFVSLALLVVFAAAATALNVLA